MEIFLIRGLDLFSPGGAGSTKPRLEFPHRARRYRVSVWRDFGCGDGALSFPGAAGRRRSPEGKLPPRAPRPLIGRGWGSADGIGARKTLDWK